MKTTDTAVTIRQIKMMMMMMKTSLNTDVDKRTDEQHANCTQLYWIGVVHLHYGRSEGHRQWSAYCISSFLCICCDAFSEKESLCLICDVVKWRHHHQHYHHHYHLLAKHSTTTMQHL